MNIDGIDAAMTTAQLDLFEEMIEKFKLRVIIELGLYKGGLANFFIKKQTINKFKYYGFEFVEADLDKQVKGRPEITIADVTKEETVEQIRKIVDGADGPVLIFCDTFDKPREMETYCGLLRVGDLIQGHDYPGEGVDDEFLAKFGEEHPDFEEIDADRIRRLIGTTVWRKIR